MLASDYPYTSGGSDDSTDCLYSASKASSVEVKEVLSLFTINSKNSNKNFKAVVQQQPVITAIGVNSIYIHSYESGVVDAFDCLGNEYNGVNHAVLIVGYGTDEVTGLDYWLLKNSWNTTWGDKGYFKLAMIENFWWGMCGMNIDPIYPVLK